MVSSPYVFKPLKPAATLRRVNIAAADVESWGTTSTKFRLGSIASRFRGEVRVRTYHTLEDFFQAMLTFDVVYFYNLPYDATFILNHCIKHKVRFQLIESSRILGVRFDDYKAVVKDFFPFCLTSLENACKTFNVKTTKFNVNFDACTTSDLTTHCENDVVMLLELVEAWRARAFEQFKQDVVHARVFSLASFALRVFRANYIQGERILNTYINATFDARGKIKVSLDRDVERFVRNTYHGGYTSTRDNKEHTGVEAWDIASSYPFAATAIPCPHGNAYKVWNRDEFYRRTRRVPGFCKVTLWFRHASYPVTHAGGFGPFEGRWRGFLTSYELDYLLSRGLAKLTEFHSGMVFAKATRAPARYARDLYRLKAATEGPDRAIFKMLLNALTGKFGEKLQRERRVYHVVDDDSEMPGQVRYLDEGVLVSSVHVTEKLHNHSFVAWISLICAFGRVYLHETIEATRAHYWDTDSAYIPREASALIPTCPASWWTEHPALTLGYWKREKVIDRFRALAPKLYVALTAGEMDVKAKGVPRAIQTQLGPAILDGRTEITTPDYQQILGYRASLARSPATEWAGDREGSIGGVVVTRKVLTPKVKVVGRTDIARKVRQRVKAAKGPVGMVSNARLSTPLQHRHLAEKYGNEGDGIEDLIDETLSYEENDESIKETMRDYALGRW